LPAEPHAGPVHYTPLLVAYVGGLAVIAAAAAAATVRLPADPALLAMGGCATLALAATAVRALSGQSSHWSASIFAHLGLTLAAGPIGGLVAVAGEVAGTRLRFGGSWFRSLFNASNQFLSAVASWGVYRAITGGGTPLAGGLLAGLAAGLVSWLVNIWLLAGVQRITDPDLRVMRYVGQNAANVLPYHLGAGLTAFGGVVLVAWEGAAGFLLLLVPVLALQMSMVVLAARTHAAQIQREAHTREREQLLRQALEASDAERHRIARNLHDGVVQDLAAIALGLRARAERGEPGDSMTLVHAADATAEAIEELRTLLREIAPPDLQEIGLAAAIDELAEPLLGEGVEVRITITPAAEGIRGSALTATYRITQEALRNVAAHAGAHHVQVAVSRADGQVDLEIADDGVGFSAEVRRQRVEEGHLGLRLIHDLARESGGELEIESTPNTGTTLRARLPVMEDAASVARNGGAAASS
jgi:signal transduction histidine kinase